MADEILTSEALLGYLSSAVYEAKLRELDSWSHRKVFQTVPNEGQPFMTVRWVLTEKTINGQPGVKARLVVFRKSKILEKTFQCVQEKVLGLHCL